MFVELPMPMPFSKLLEFLTSKQIELPTATKVCICFQISWFGSIEFDDEY